MVAPCITALRHLSTSIISILGSDQGTKHEPADLSTDIELLMKSLSKNNVYQIKGRVFADGDGTPTPDVITVGIQQLSDSSSNPLTEYNTAFLKLQARSQLIPLVDDWSDAEASVSGGVAALPSTASPLAPEPPSQPTPPTAVVNPALFDPIDITESVQDDGSDRDDSEDDDGFIDEEELTAFERVMDEVAEPTLTRDMAADVALDMDGGDDGFVFGGNMDDSVHSDSDSDSDPFVDDVNDSDYDENE